MKIALCKSGFQGPISGADETLVTYATELRAAGHDVTVLLLYPFSPKDNYYRRLKTAGVPVASIVERAWMFSALRLARELVTHLLFVFVIFSRFPGHVRRIWQSVLRLISGAYLGRCRRYFDRYRFDLLHVLTPDSGTTVMIRAGRAAGIPILYQELGTPRHVPTLRISYDRLAEVTSLCAEVAALSPRLARQWAPRLPNARGIGVLPLMVSAPRVWAFPRRPVPFDIVFGFGARLEPAKGPAILLKAFRQLLQWHEGAYLRIAGVGPQGHLLRRTAREFELGERCEFIPNYTEAVGRAAFMQTLDVFVLPSFAEGTPNGIIEAMAAGIPVIASAVGGIPDVVTEETGILVPCDNPGALAVAMLRLAEDGKLRERMGRAARRRYEELFSPQAVLPILLERYSRLGSGPPPPSLVPAPSSDWSRTRAFAAGP